MAGALTAEEIRDVNTRYHDAAAAAYDAKWGIDFGVVGREQVILKLTKALGRIGYAVRILPRPKVKTAAKARKKPGGTAALHKPRKRVG